MPEPIKLNEVGHRLAEAFDLVDDTSAGRAKIERADFVLCVYAGQDEPECVADNIRTTCADCGSPIVHRPHAPKAAKKICLNCALRRSREMKSKATPRQAAVRRMRRAR